MGGIIYFGFDILEKSDAEDVRLNCKHDDAFCSRFAPQPIYMLDFN